MARKASRSIALLVAVVGSGVLAGAQSASVPVIDRPSGSPQELKQQSVEGTKSHGRFTGTIRNVSERQFNLRMRNATVRVRHNLDLDIIQNGAEVAVTGPVKQTQGGRNAPQYFIQAESIQPVRRQDFVLAGVGLAMLSAAGMVALVLNRRRRTPSHGPEVPDAAARLAPGSHPAHALPVLPAWSPESARQLGFSVVPPAEEDLSTFDPGPGQAVSIAKSGRTDVPAADFRGAEGGRPDGGRTEATVVSYGSVEVVHGPNAGQRFSLVEGENLIGRSKQSGNRIILSDPEVSKVHGVIAVEPGGRAIYTDRSRNGSYVRGARVQNQQISLSDGTEIYLGNTALKLTLQDQVGLGWAAFRATEHWALVCVEGPDRGLRIPLQTGLNLVGRAHVREIQDLSVSGEHAQVIVSANGVRLADQGSRFGTQLNGRPVGTVPLTLELGDEIRLGPTSIYRVETA